MTPPWRWWTAERRTPPGPTPPGPPGRTPPGVTPPGAPKDFDPGLARERTRLAWTRTSIAFAAIGVAILKTRLAAGLIVLALAAIVWGLRHLFREAAADRSQSVRLLGVTLTVVAVGIVALVIAFLGHHS